MNATVVELCVAVAGGLLAGLVAMLRLRAVARDVLPFLVPASPWQKQLAAWNRQDAGKREARDAATAERADTLRNIYLAAIEAEAREEVPAQ